MNVSAGGNAFSCAFNLISGSGLDDRATRAYLDPSTWRPPPALAFLLDQEYLFSIARDRGDVMQLKIIAGHYCVVLATLCIAVATLFVAYLIVHSLLY